MMRVSCRQCRDAGGRARGFTLVELLIVVAILGLLIGMLMPTFGMAREMARDTLCLTNHSLMVKALATYEGEHGAFPYNYAHYGSYGETPRWALGELAPYLPGGRPGLTDLRNLDEGEFPACYTCPNADLDEVYLSNPSNKYHACYFTNVAVRCNRGWGPLFNDYTGTGRPPGDDRDSGGEARIHGRLCPDVSYTHWRSVYFPRMSSVPMLESTIFTGDTSDIEFEEWNGTLTYPGKWHTRPGWGWIHSSLGFTRHRGRLQMGYLDGSARTYTYAKLVADFSHWPKVNPHEPDELTGDFMIQMPLNMSCNRSHIHNMPAPVCE